MTEQPAGLAAALVEVQRRLPVLHRDKVATVESQRGRYSYKYVDLASVTEVVMPLLAEFGLAFISRTTVLGEHFVLSCSLVHAPTGEREEAVMPLPTGTTAQVLGSWLSYGRRYLLACLTGLATSDEDDDGAAASKPARKAAPRRASTSEAPADEVELKRFRNWMFALYREEDQDGAGDVEAQRKARLADLSAIVGRAVKSSSDLTVAELKRVVGALEERQRAREEGDHG